MTWENIQGKENSYEISFEDLNISAGNYIIAVGNDEEVLRAKFTIIK